MLELIVGRIIERGISQSRIPREQYNVYFYGYTLLVEVAICTAFAIILAFSMNKIAALIVFSVTFVPLRSLGGGYHASKPWKCIVLSYSILCVFFVICEHPVLVINWRIIMLIEIITLILIQPIIENLKYAKFITTRTLVNLICCMCWIIVYIQTNTGVNNYSAPILFSIIIWLVSIIADYVLNRM